ncbi:MAG: hypothetical protein A2167_01175 [Planctomycetes bacterium RBG_13_46_10]|nr:MAG: hypothetical protein A2167_01175 [Planctomycetes bacterium RBG_13_46_10]
MHIQKVNKNSDTIISRYQKQEVIEHIVVRPLNGNDSITEITDLLHRAFAKGSYQPFNYPAAQQNNETTAEQIKRGRGCVAVIDERIVGVGIVWPPAGPATRWGYPRRRVAHLRQLAVEPDFQSLGIGTIILNACECAAMETGANELSGSAPIGSQQVSFYKRRGYRLLRYVSWSNTDYDSVIFTKPLVKNDRFYWIRFLVDKTKYFRSFVIYKTKHLLLTTAVVFRDVAGTISIPVHLRRKARKIFTKDPWKRRFKMYLTVKFWKKKFMAMSILRWFCWITRSLTKRLNTGNPIEILLYCQCPAIQYAEHLRRFAEVFSNDPRLHFVVTFEWYLKKTPESYKWIRKILPYPEVSNARAYLREWDMIVAADHPMHQLMFSPRKCPTLQIGHGGTNKSKPGDSNTRPYGKYALKKRTLCSLFSKRQPLYTRMFEAEEEIRDLAVRVNPLLKDRIVVVGNLVYDSILNSVELRKQFRHELGIKDNEIVVFVMSTWRDECLFRSIGDAFLEESRKLLGKYRFILSIHPNEYRPRPSGDRVWGEYLRTQQQYGYIIREPENDYVPYLVAYLVASDIVLSDHTCLVEYAALLQRPIVCVPVNDEYIWKGSITWEIFQFAPKIHDMADLHKALLKVKENDYPWDKLRQLSNTMNRHPGQAVNLIRNEVYTMLKMQHTNLKNPIDNAIYSNCYKDFTGEM